MVSAKCDGTNVFTYEDGRRCRCTKEKHVNQYPEGLSERATSRSRTTYDPAFSFHFPSALNEQPHPITLRATFISIRIQRKIRDAEVAFEMMDRSDLTAVQRIGNKRLLAEEKWKPKKN